MKELTVQDIDTILHHDENRVMEAKKTTGEIVAGMQSGRAFLSTEGGWLFFGIHPKTLKILGQAVRATYALIKQYPGLNAPQLASKCGKGDSTIERHVAILRKNDLIEHRGADKTGGYYIKEIQNNND